MRDLGPLHALDDALYHPFYVHRIVEAAREESKPDRTPILVKKPTPEEADETTEPRRIVPVRLWQRDAPGNA